MGGNLNQLARHFNSGGADTEQIRAKLLDELADLTAFRLSAEKVLGELYGNAQAYQLSRKNAALFNHKPHICDIQFDVVANDLNNRIVIKLGLLCHWKRLIYQHDEFSGKVILTNKADPCCGNPTCSTPFECGDFSFATACLLANRKYGKNTQHGDIKSHQYIISFDPRDAADNSLTMEKAQALWPEILRRKLPRSSCHRLHSPGWTQPFGKHPCPHRDRQRPNTRGGA